MTIENLSRMPHEQLVTHVQGRVTGRLAPRAAHESRLDADAEDGSRDSSYVRLTSVPSARIETYPRRRRTLRGAAVARLAAWPVDGSTLVRPVAGEVRYADFFRLDEREHVVA